MLSSHDWNRLQLLGLVLSNTEHWHVWQSLLLRWRFYVCSATSRVGNTCHAGAFVNRLV
jgi:hypothetical protein